MDGTLDANWIQQIKELGKQDNVFCKISGMVTEATWGKWKKEDFTPYLDVVFEAFDFNRIMFGSDWPVCLLSGQYKEVLDIVRNYLLKFPKDVQKKVMGLNAISFYNLTG